MQELRCARCGREGPEAHAFGAAWARAAAAVDDSLPNLLAEAWLGVDICPQCQTEPEKVLAAERIAAATLAAITSLADRGVDPHSEENPVITFAMRIQEALLGRIPPGHDHRERDDERDDENVEDGTKADDQAPPTSAKTFDVAITGAFLTGCALQVDIDNYEAVQRDLTSALTGQQEGAGWSSACAEVATGTYASGGGFTTNVPLVLVCRTGEETLEYTRTILDDQAKRAHDWQQERIPGWILDPTGIRIEVYDVGVGVIDGTFNVTAPTSTQTGEFAAGIKEIVELHVDEKGRDRSALAGDFAGCAWKRLPISAPPSIAARRRRS